MKQINKLKNIINKVHPIVLTIVAIFFSFQLILSKARSSNVVDTDYIRKIISRNLILFQSVEFHKKYSEDKTFLRDPPPEPFPIPDEGWKLELYLKQIDSFNSFVNDGYSIYEYSWPGCAFRSSDDKLLQLRNFDKKSLNYQLSQRGIVCYREHSKKAFLGKKVIFLGGNLFLDDKIGELLINKRFTDEDSMFKKTIIYFRYYNYIPEGIKVSRTDNYCNFEFFSKKLNSKYKGTINYSQGVLKDSVFVKSE